MATYWSRKAASTEHLPWQYLLIAAIAVVVAASGDRAFLLIAGAVGLSIVAAIWMDRRLAVPLIILTLPLEISKEIFPFLPTSQVWETAGSRISILDVGRIA